MSSLDTLSLIAADDPTRLGAALVLLTGAAATSMILRTRAQEFTRRTRWHSAATPMGAMLAEQATVHRGGTAALCSEIASQALPLLRVQPGAGGSARLTFANDTALAVSLDRPDQVAELTGLVSRGVVVLAGVDVTETGRAALLFRSPAGLCTVVVSHATRVPASAG